MITKEEASEIKKDLNTFKSKLNDLHSQISPPHEDNEKATKPVQRETVDKTNMKDNFQIYQSSVKAEKGSFFQAFCKQVNNQIEVDEFFANILNSSDKIQAATHKIVAYKFNSVNTYPMNSNDDGEIGAGEKILDLINSEKLCNVAIIVCRWFGNEFIFHRRFELIIECSKEALNKGNFIDSKPEVQIEESGGVTHTNTDNGSPSENIRHTIILGDSTSAAIGAKTYATPNKKESCPNT